jgi:hypothetical protein
MSPTLRLELALVRTLLDTIERNADGEASLQQLAEQLERVGQHCLAAAETLSESTERRVA